MLLLGGVTLVGALPRAIRVTQPKTFSWDEGYYIPAARGYLAGDFTVNFEHPPLAKWLIAAGIEAFGDDPLGWRAAALIAGIATIPLTWLLVRRLMGSIWWATFAAGLVATDGLLIVQSRTGMLDSMLPPLIVGGAMCVVTHLDRHERGAFSWWLLTAGILLGAAAAVKWQAAGPVVGVFVAFAVTARRDRRALGVAALTFAVVPFAVYLASYIGHARHGLTPLGFVRLHRNMWDYHRHFRFDHPRDSSPLVWLWLQRPAAYSTLIDDGRIAIHLSLGNIALWWSFVAALPLLIVTWWRGRDRTVELVLFGWVSLHLVWFVVLRPGFLFYLTPLVPFMAVGVTWLARWVTQRWRWGWLAPLLIGVAALACFALYLPVWTYQEISLDRFDWLILFDGWEI